MARKSRAQLEREKMMEARTPLVLLPAFQSWIETLRTTKDGAVQYMVDHTTTASQRESLAAAGEVRAYLAIIQDYEAQREQLEQQAQAMEAERLANAQQTQ
jgi:arginine/ornithine N-succinyltransferase beta subunit